LVISSSNPELADFIPSPFHTRYLSADQLRALLQDAEFDVEMFVGFEAPRRRLRHHVIRALRKIAARLKLTPKSMAGKAVLKRVFYGHLRELGPEIDIDIPIRPLVSHEGGPALNHRLLYAVARRAEA
jgi:hypothetical protein